VLALLDLAAQFKRAYSKTVIASLGGGAYKCLTLFFEPSTRTRLSFESAAHGLGMAVMSTADAALTSSSAKGERLEDMARVLSAYADVIVMRHPERGAVARFASKSRVPVINAGDGIGEHPTQALIDLFTLREAFGQLEGLHIGLCGDLRHGRTVHSLLRLLLMFGCDVTALSPPELGLPQDMLQDLLRTAVGRLRQETDLKARLPTLDALYMTRVQKERFADPAAYDRLQDVYSIARSDLTMAKNHFRLLHPLPRLAEIAVDVDDDSRAAYFEQAENGIPVRTALLTALLGLRL